MNNLTFVFTKFADSAARELLSLIKHAKNKADIKTNKDVVVFMTGAWDLQFRSLHFYIYNSTESLFQALTELRSSAMWKNCRLIWINNIAFPEAYIGKRNNFVTQAANEYMRSRIRRLGVEEFDSFGVSYPRNNQAVNVQHYIYGIGESSYFVGDVGKEIVYGLIRHICPT